MSSRLFQVLGVTAVAGAGYYLYTAGGDPKVAEKKFEKDVSHLSNKAKNELPGAYNDAKQDVKLNAERAKSQAKGAIDSFDTSVERGAAQAKAAGRDLSNKASAYSTDAEKKLADARSATGSQLKGAVDSFDKNVESGAAQTKSGISSWFGGK